MITIKTYSERGMLVKGITADQAQAMIGALGKAVTQFVPSMGGYVFSRKREPQIRALVAALQGAQPVKAMKAKNAPESLPGALDDSIPYEPTPGKLSG